jgi:hypothetical protein
LVHIHQTGEFENSSILSAPRACAAFIIRTCCTGDGRTSSAREHRARGCAYHYYW